MIIETTATLSPPPTKRRGRPRKQPIDNPAPIEPPSCIHRLDERTRKAIDKALKLLEENAIYRTDALCSPSDVHLYLKLKLAGLEREEFHIIWLDAQNRIIAFDCMFLGTLNQAHIYPREVVKAALSHNAATCILAHNHPSGKTAPSQADRDLTRSLVSTLSAIDVQVLDHLIVAGDSRPFSFKENFLM